MDRSICWGGSESIYVHTRIKIQAEKKLIHADAFRLQPRHYHSHALTGLCTLRALNVMAWCLIKPRFGTYAGENSRLHHAASAQFPWVSRWNHHLFDFNCLSLHDPLPRYQSDKAEWCNFMCKPPPAGIIKWRQDEVLLLRLDPAPWWYCIQLDKTTAHPNYF